MKKITITTIFSLILILTLFSFTNNASAQTVSNTTAQQNHVFTSRLIQGMRGNSVCALQLFLIKFGYLNIINPTCYFGPLTTVALQQFQTGNNLPPVGAVGPQTRALLNSLNSNANTQVGSNASSNANIGSNTGSNTGTNTGSNTGSASTGSNTSAAHLPTNPTPPPVPPTNPPLPPNTPTTPTPTPQTCVSTSTPSVTVISPNGGERLHFGELVEVTWSSCNLPTKEVNIYLEYFVNNASVAQITVLSLNTADDGSEKVYMPNDIAFTLSGPYYKIAVSDSNKIIADDSDSMFYLE